MAVCGGELLWSMVEFGRALWSMANIVESSDGVSWWSLADGCGGVWWSVVVECGGARSVV